MIVSGKAKLAGVVGDPIAHSLSPLLHTHWLEAHGIDGAYVPLKVARGVVYVRVAWAAPGGLLRRQCHGAAQGSGLCAGGRRRRRGARGRRGQSSDLPRTVLSKAETPIPRVFLRRLVEHLGANALQGKIATLVGAGGAARAAIIALDALGAKEIRIVARDVTRGDTLARDMRQAVKAQVQSFALRGLEQSRLRHAHCWSTRPAPACAGTRRWHCRSIPYRATLPCAISSTIRWRRHS